MKRADLVIDRDRHARICYLLALRNLNLADIARQAGVGTSAVSSVSIGKSRSAHIESVIAKALGCEAKDLFPDRYKHSGGEEP